MGEIDGGTNFGRNGGKGEDLSTVAGAGEETTGGGGIGGVGEIFTGEGVIGFITGVWEAGFARDVSLLRPFCFQRY